MCNVKAKSMSKFPATCTYTWLCDRHVAHWAWHSYVMWNIKDQATVHSRWAHNPRACAWHHSEIWTSITEIIIRSWRQIGSPEWSGAIGYAWWLIHHCWVLGSRRSSNTLESNDLHVQSHECFSFWRNLVHTCVIHECKVNTSRCKCPEPKLCYGYCLDHEWRYVADTWAISQTFTTWAKLHVI